MTKNAITTPPQGYSLFDTDYGPKGIWVVEYVAFRTPLGIAVTDARVRLLGFDLLEGILSVDENGNTVWLPENERTTTRHPMRGIPDSEHPAGGMTVAHTHFNETTKKWEKPSIESKVHEYHEREADNDVPSSLNDFCLTEMALALDRMIDNLSTSEQRGTNVELRRTLLNCAGQLVIHNAEHALAHKWIRSVGHITHPAYVDVQAGKAIKFARAIVAHFSKATVQAPIWKYYLRLYKELEADRTRAKADKFLPRQVEIVKTLSSPAVGTERTAQQVLDALTPLVNPGAQSGS